MMTMNENEIDELDQEIQYEMCDECNNSILLENELIYLCKFHYEELKVKVQTLTLENEKLKKEFEEYKHAGIQLRGWWCQAPILKHAGNTPISQLSTIPCDTFNGQEREIHEKCRNCGAKKP